MQTFQLTIEKNELIKLKYIESVFAFFFFFQLFYFAVLAAAVFGDHHFNYYT